MSENVQSIDLNQLKSMFTEKVTVHTTVDTFAAAPPIMPNKYIAVLKPKATGFITPDETKSYTREDGTTVPSRKYFKLNCYFEIQGYPDPKKSTADLNGKFKRFDQSFSSLVFERDGGKKASEVSSLAGYFGLQIPPDSPEGLIGTAVATFIQSGKAVFELDTDLRAGWIQADEKKGEKRGHWVAQGEKNFPLGADNKRKLEVTGPDGTVYPARAYVKDFRAIKAAGATK